MALSVSCKSNEEAEGEVNIGEYAGTYTSDNKAYGKDSGQYFVLRVNSDNIECSVSDNQTMSTVAITFSKFTKTGGGNICVRVRFNACRCGIEFFWK